MSELSCALQSPQYLQLRIVRQLWGHPKGINSFSSENDRNLPHQPAVRPQCMLPASHGAAQGKSPRELDARSFPDSDANLVLSGVIVVLPYSPITPKIYHRSTS